MAFRAALLSALLLTAFHAPAQAITAGLSGTVKNPSGTFISNSALTVINTEESRSLARRGRRAATSMLRRYCLDGITT